MRQTIDPRAPRLCNNCALREDSRTNKREDKMTTVDILIKCPRDTHIAIEEMCIAQGIDFSRYFMQLHADNMQLKHDLENGPDQEVSFKPKPAPKNEWVSEKDTPKKKAGKK